MSRAKRAAEAALTRARGALGRLAMLVLPLLVVAGVCAVMGASPLDVAARLWKGAFGTTDQAARVLAMLAPLLLCSSGLVLTFQAGLYNLGVEGQIVVGAVVATGASRALGGHLPPAVLVPLMIAGGAAGGALWGAGTGALHVRGKVSEIFAGLGANFLAQGLALYLVFGPWKRPGVASMSGTEPLDRALWLGTLGNTDASPVALALGLLAVVFAVVVMQYTHLGLRLRAVGLNRRAAEVLGVRSARHLLGAFTLCGALAGVAGALQVMGVFHRLIPGVSSNLGFLALLVVMLSGFDARLVLPVALFFSALTVGSLQLPMTLELESSLAGVIQGLLVLFALLAPRAVARDDAAAEGGKRLRGEVTPSIRPPPMSTRRPAAGDAVPPSIPAGNLRPPKLPNFGEE